MFSEKLLYRYQYRVACSNTQLFRDGGNYHIETSPFICRTSQRTGFYMIGTSLTVESIVPPFAGAYSGACQTWVMELFVEIVTIF